MEKVKSDSQTPYVAGVEQVDSKQDKIAADIELEHELTVRDVLRNHKGLVWWCFYWAMAAVGW